MVSDSNPQLVPRNTAVSPAGGFSVDVKRAAVSESTTYTTAHTNAAHNRRQGRNDTPPKPQLTHDADTADAKRHQRLP